MTPRRLILCIAATISLSLNGTIATAQDAPPRVEVGAQVSVLRFGDFDTTTTGVGGRVSYELAKWAAIEAEANFFPDDDLLLAPSTLTPNLRVAYVRRRVDAFFGMKLGMRNDKFGVFAKVRPGFTRVTNNGGIECVGSECALILLVQPEYRTEFALDFGGVFEVYPSSRTVARVELGDTMIRNRSVAPPCWGQSCTTHNLSTRFGVGLRF
jgi:hypothetical protein